jgi:hypothetical protein
MGARRVYFQAPPRRSRGLALVSVRQGVSAVESLLPGTSHVRNKLNLYVGRILDPTMCGWTEFTIYVGFLRVKFPYTVKLSF